MGSSVQVAFAKGLGVGEEKKTALVVAVDGANAFHGKFIFCVTMGQHKEHI